MASCLGTGLQMRPKSSLWLKMGTWKVCVLVCWKTKKSEGKSIKACSRKIQFPKPETRQSRLDFGESTNSTCIKAEIFKSKERRELQGRESCSFRKNNGLPLEWEKFFLLQLNQTTRKNHEWFYKGRFPRKSLKAPLWKWFPYAYKGLLRKILSIILL